jgi:hypothetical protein
MNSVGTNGHFYSFRNKITIARLVCVCWGRATRHNRSSQQRSTQCTIRTQSMLLGSNLSKSRLFVFCSSRQRHFISTCSECETSLHALSYNHEPHVVMLLCRVMRLMNSNWQAALALWRCSINRELGTLPSGPFEKPKISLWMEVVVRVSVIGAVGGCAVRLDTLLGWE